MALTEGTRFYLVHKWYREELGRLPSITDIAEHAKVIDEHGVLAAFQGIYDSPEAKAYRKKVKRAV
jgi:hypothetical protein